MFLKVFNELMILMVFLLVGQVVRTVVRPLQRLFMPASIVAGVIALIIGPQVLGWIDLPSTFSEMPTPMINVVLTCTIFGTVLSKSKIKTYAGAINVIATTYFAQLAVGVVAGNLLRRIWPSLPYCWGVMTVFSYWGGHGAASSAGTLFEGMGVHNMLSVGIVLATLGLILAMVLGMILVNLGARKGYATYTTKPSKSVESPEDEAEIRRSERRIMGFKSVPSSSINGAAFQLSLIMFSMFLGTKLFRGIIKFIPSVSRVPTLLYGIVGAAIVWFVMVKTDLDKYADKTVIDNISGIALEICIFTATATINLDAFAAYLAPIIIYTAVIMLLMVFICTVLVKRWIKVDWFELALMAFGQGIGSAPSGLALARCVDPESKSTAWEAFGVALGVFSPLTSTLVAILPVIGMRSELALLLIGLSVCTFTFIFGEKVLRKG